MRFIMSLIVLVFVVLAVAYTAVERLSSTQEAAVERARGAFETPMIQLQAALSDHLPDGEADVAQRHMSMMAIDEHVVVLMLVDDIGIIGLSNQSLLEGSPASQVEGYSEAVAADAAATLESRVELSDDGEILRGYFPVNLGAREGALRPDRIGILYSDYSVSADLARARNDAVAAATHLAAFLLLLALAQYLALHFLVTRRVGRLTSAIRSVAGGRFGVTVGMTGSDEIGQLARSIDFMTCQLAEEHAALESSEHLHRLLADNAADWVFWIGPDGTFAYCSPSCEDITGYAAAEFMTDPGLMERIIHPEDADLYHHHRGTEWRAGSSDLRFRIIRRDGSVRWIGHACQAIVDEDGEVRGSRGSNRDITAITEVAEALREANRDLEARVEERTRQLADSNEELVSVNEELSSTIEQLAVLNEELAATNEDLEVATQAAEAASRAKSDFIASMSHELRTPLNSIIGFSDILLRGMAGPLTDEEFTQLTMINTSGHHLLQLINEILDLSKIEVGRMELRVEDFDPIVVVREAVDTVSAEATQKGLALVIDSTSCPASMRSDRLRLEQVLINLLGNAVKFTDSGGVSVSVSCKGPLVTFVVADTGRGIPGDELEKIFGEFYQVEIPAEVKTAGTGLGLPLSQRLAYMMGGHITVKSELGVGSTFIVRLPLTLVADPEGDLRAEG